MAEKPNGGTIVLREQIIEDPVTGITFKVERTASGEGWLRLHGNIEFGNRDLMFDAEGRLVGTGTGLCRSCPSSNSSWLRVEGQSQ